jgi:hypothetical protein
MDKARGHVGRAARALPVAVACAVALWGAQPVRAQAPPQTPSQMLQQISDLVKQLQDALSPPAEQAAVTTADALAAALKKCGAIKVGPGTFTGNFVVTPGCPTVLTGSGQASTVLAPKDRLAPTLSGAAVRDVTVQDLTVMSGAPDRDAVVFGTVDEADPANLPQRVTLRRVTVTATGGLGHRGVNMNGSDMTLDSSTVTGFCEKGRDSQAFLAVNGPGPYTITNNVLEASGDNIMFGGADPGVPGLVPADITIRNNTLRKPGSYRGACTVKNLLELKSARRVLVEGNTLDGNWADGQSGNGIVLTVRDQGGKCPQCVVDDVTLRRNTLTNNLDGYAVNILGNDDVAPSQQTQKITITGNLFADAPGGIQVINGVQAALVVTDNSFLGVTGKFLQWDKSNRPKVMTPLTFSRNVVRAGQYGIMGDGSTGPGLPSLLAYATVTEWNGNVIEHNPARTLSYPAGTGNTLLQPGALASLLDPKTLKLLSGAAGY